MDQNERKVGLINNDGKNLSDNKIFEESFKERFGEATELTVETNF